MKKLLIALVLAVYAAAIAAPTLTHAQDSETSGAITVYTALEDDQIKAYLAPFKVKYPNITVNTVRESTGIITARLLAEKDNIQADVVWGTAASSLLVLESQKMVEPYAPKGLDKVDPAFRDKANPPAWVGIDAWESAFCVNTVELKKKNLTMPETWFDLSKPEYKGFIVMPDPAASGTGFLSVSGILQMFAQGQDLLAAPKAMAAATMPATMDASATLKTFKMDDKAVLKDLAGWKYLDALDKNIATYTASGSKPCKMAGAGETVIGVSFGYRGLTQAKNGEPIQTVFPKEGSGWDLEANALLKKATIKPAAKTFLDWAISDEAMKLYAKNYPVTSVKTGEAIPAGFPANPLKQYIPNDFYWAAANRDAILKEWTTRYAAKSENKK